MVFKLSTFLRMLQAYSVFAIVASVILIFMMVYFKKSRERIGYILSGILMSVLLVPFILFLIVWVDARYIEPNWIQVKKINIKSEVFNENLKNVKIVQISDLHIEKIGFREKSLVKKINSLMPDIILITGDLIESAEGVKPCLAILGSLKAKNGIYAILGNSDRYYTDESKFIASLREIGVATLRHDNIKMDFGENGKLWFVGLSDKYGEFAQYGQINYIASAFEYVPIRDPKILLIHNPDVAELSILSEYNPQLILAGHTHGGQVGLSFLRSLSWYAQRSRYMAGLFYVNNVPLYVNRGIGTNTRPIRFFCRPEITVIRLVKG